tara:strand:+ start:1361 stop:1810 length:450 start_codon:yes stop_codon:yes gene_type:complete
MDKLDNLLINNNLSISCIESCSSGKLANILSSNSGSSKYFTGGIILYNDNIKSKILNIDIELINKYSAVSKEICCLMVNKGKKIFDSDICISITGYHEPSDDAIVFIGINYKSTNIYKYNLKGNSRDENREIIINQSIKLLLEEINKKP